MDESNANLTVADVLARVRHRPVLAVLPIVVGLALSVAYVLLVPKTYTSKAAVQVQAVVADPYGVDLAKIINMATEAQVAQSASVAQIASRTLGSPADEVQRSFTVDTPQDTQIINIRFVASSPAAAARGAQTVAQSYLTYRSQATSENASKQLLAIDKQISEVTEKLADKPSAGQLTALSDDLRALQGSRRQLELIKAAPGGRVITPAAEPQTATSPKPLVNLPMGFMGGAIVGLALSILLPLKGSVRPVPVTRSTAPRRAREAAGGRSSEFDRMLNAGLPPTPLPAAGAAAPQPAPPPPQAPPPAPAPAVAAPVASRPAAAPPAAAPPAAAPPAARPAAARPAAAAPQPAAPAQQPAVLAPTVRPYSRPAPVPQPSAQPAAPVASVAGGAPDQAGG